MHNSAGQREEMTVTAVVLGLILSVVMGAANVYLGLRVGMTVSASIPAAVVAMAVLNGIMRRSSILEANLVQTTASAGESLAAGIIFTMPALVFVGIWKEFDFWITTGIALSGGLLGVLLMIPMRKVFIVDNRDLQYPEGLACAKVLRAGGRRVEESRGNRDAMTIFLGLGVGAVFKVFQSFLGLFKSSVEYATFRVDRVFYFGSDLAPALIGVGLIVGLPISVQIFTGGAIGWLVTIPLISLGESGESATAVADQLWKSHVRYMGVGAMVVGGIVSIWKVRHGLVAAVREVKRQIGTRPAEAEQAPSERNMDGRMVLFLSVLCVLLIAGIYKSLLGALGITLITTGIMIVMSFFFTAVASYIVGLVGNSNSPVSGMTITAVLGTGGLISLFHLFGLLESDGPTAIVATLGVAGIVCCVACTAGDVCNDLKTGYLVGATPRNQQIMQILGVFVAAFVMAPVMTVLHEASINEGTGGIGTKDLPAPQAVLFAELAKGFFGDGKIPWNMVAWGVGIGIVLLVADWALAKSKVEFRLHVMPVAVGIYLPLLVSVPILLGGLLHFALKRRNDEPGATEAHGGILVASGVIAGESLVGVLLGFLAYGGMGSLNLAERLNMSTGAMEAVSVAALLCVAGWMYVRASGHAGRS